MPRGFKVDLFTTARMKFLDKRSFVSQAKRTAHSHNDWEAVGHLILYGKDVLPAREDAIRRSAFRNGVARCQICGCLVNDHVSETAPNKLELDHILSKPWERCWCPENLRILCHKCHSEKHAERAPKFSRSQLRPE